MTCRISQIVINFSVKTHEIRKKDTSFLLLLLFIMPCVPNATSEKYFKKTKYTKLLYILSSIGIKITKNT